ncbi:hemolysin family protein [Luedemannella helvata]|uniref:Hemolysin family protein n=1 Tax=Luedemannella helvata TaxID=349315 RepID=A0ABP4WRF3_9ACTN
MLIAIGLLAIVALTVATGYFVAQEFSFVAVDRGKLRTMAEGGDAAAGRALAVTSRLSFMLSGAQLGITVTALLTGYVAEPYLGEGLAELLGLAGVPRAASLSISVAFALLLATAIQMVLGELAPKNLAIARPEALSRALARSTLIYMALAGPLIRLFDATSNRLLRLVGIEPIEELPHGATAEDLDRIIESSLAQGVLDRDTSRLLGRGLHFRARTADEIMIPRVDVITVGARTPASRIVELLDTGHTRFPVVGTSVDDLIGVVSINEVRDLPPERRATTAVADIAPEPLLVPGTATLPLVLERLRAERRQMACVMDEYGGFAGVLTLEDVAEELVGDIRDEDDHAAPAPVRDADGSWVVPGRWRLDEIAEVTAVRLPDSDRYDTLAGLIMARLGRVAAPGDRVTVALPAGVDADGQPQWAGQAALVVEQTRRRVPHLVRLKVDPS